MKNKYTLLFFVLGCIIFLFTTCSKDFGAKPTYRGKSLAGTWAKEDPFYYPTAQFFDTVTMNWRSFIGFSFTSVAEPDVLGFYNPYVTGKGTNVLGLRTIHSTQNISSDSGTYNLQAPKCLKLIPDNLTANVGNVVVLTQDIKCIRADRSFFIIKIMPATQPGRYNEETKTFEVDVMFDETSIGGSATKIRKYKFSTN